MEDRRSEDQSTLGFLPRVDRRTSSLVIPERRPPVVRLPGNQRPGSRIVISRCDSIKAENVYGRLRLQGYVDPILRVYKGGGESENFFWATDHGVLITVSLGVRSQVLKHPCDVEWIEMVDNRKNACYRTDRHTFETQGEEYRAPRPGMVTRYGVNVLLWDMITGQI